MINITFPDGAVRQYQNGITALDIAKSISEGLARKVLAAEVAGDIQDATRPIDKDTSIKFLTWDDEKGKSKLYNKVKNDCVKLFKNKDYMVIQHDKDDDESFTAYKYAKNGVVEMCVLTISDDELILDTAQMNGLSKEAMNNVEFKFKQ